MNLRFSYFLVLNLVYETVLLLNVAQIKSFEGKRVDDHTVLTEYELVTSETAFPYAAAILNKDSFLSAGSLISNSWVLTAVDPMFFSKQKTRFLRVHLGSTNYKKGGLTIPVKNIEIHPYFNRTMNSPEFDLALLRLAHPVRAKPSLDPIRVQFRRKPITNTHFIVTFWNSNLLNSSDLYNSNVQLARRRKLLLSHIHPAEAANCSEYLRRLRLNTTNIICLETDTPCKPAVGSPVVLNRVLWGVISSWTPDVCNSSSHIKSPVLAGLSSGPSISTWIQSVMRGGPWTESIDVDDNDNDVS